MNRRQFFGSLAGAVALSAGGIALVETPKTIFLPPRQGWFQTPLRMREISQYHIATHSMPYRYDAAWLDAAGERQQWHVFFPEVTAVDVARNPRFVEWQRDVAREQFERIRRKQGLNNSRQMDLEIPRGVPIARYV